MFTFRASITFTVMSFVLGARSASDCNPGADAALPRRGAASAYMDAASTKALGRLHGELKSVSSLVNVLATSSSLADSNERSETGRAIPLFKQALRE
jgi:adenylate cyclase